MRRNGGSADECGRRGKWLSLGLSASVALAGCAGEPQRSWEELVCVDALSAERARAAEALPARAGQNVLLITIDTCRADHIGCYGHPDQLTPNIDALAARGALFADAVCPSPITLPSHCSIMTGLYPTAHGVRDNGRFQLRESVETMAEIFAAGGYRTAAFVSAFPVLSKFGLAQGFDTYSDELPVQDLRRRTSGLMGNRDARTVTDAATEWLAGQGDEPFFSWVHYFDPHYPYEPPEPYATRYRGAPYAGEVAFVDAEIGRLVETVERIGVAENTLIVVTADHGEALGEHDEATHALLLYDATIRVPLVIAPAAAGEADREPLIVSSQVRLVDVMPTVLKLAGLGAPAGLDGISLCDDSASAPPPSAAISYLETYATWYGLGWSPLRGVRASGWKFIEAPKAEFYDLASDPRELNDLRDADRKAGRAWKIALSEIGAETAETEEIEVDSETAERLAALGYVGADRKIESPRPLTGDDPALANPMEMITVFIDLVMPGLDAYNRGDFDEASALCRRALAQDPSNSKALGILAESESRRGEFEEARRVYEKILEQGTANISAHFFIGNLAYREGKFDEAERSLRAALAIDRRFPEALHDLGNVLIAKGNKEEAEQLLTEAVELDSTFSPALLSLGNLYLSLERRSDALDAYLRCLMIDPSNRTAESRVISLVADDAIGDAALGALKESWRAGDRSEGRLIALLIVTYERGHHDEAMRLLRKAFADGRRSAALLRIRAWIHRNEGRPDEALDDLRMAVEIEPRDADARTNLAAAYRSRGMLAEAGREYEASLNINPRGELALVGLGIVYAELDRLGQAMQLWQSAVVINPNSPARENIEKVQQMLARGEISQADLQ